MPVRTRSKREGSPPASPERRQRKMALVQVDLKEWWHNLSGEEWAELGREQEQATLDENRDYIEETMLQEALDSEESDEVRVVAE